MPELPEVETVVRTLEQKLRGAQIAELKIYYPRLVDNMPAEQFSSQLAGQHFRKFGRRGKYLIFGLDDYELVAHLRMEGKFYVEPDLSQFDKHTHLVITLTDGRYVLYHDVRKFGRMELYAKGEELAALAKLGLEPFDPELSIGYLRDHIGKKTVLKELLLDQSVIAGIGNIYANEICFAIRRRPDALAATLSDEELKSLIREARRILRAAIREGGTTIRSYTSSLGVTGKFQQQLFVHGRAGEPCRRCGATIIKTRIGGRGTYYCPECQK